VQSRIDGYLNPQAFSRPAPYEFGTAPRTLSRARGPGLRNADVSMFKNFNFTADGAVRLEFRAEAFNVTNTPIFSDPNMMYGATNFGVITGVQNSPRQVQFGLKLYF
jgi:trimeric autotransporter adhesin